MHAMTGKMANQNGRNGTSPDDRRWHTQQHEQSGYDDERGANDRDAERRGMGQSGYGAGRNADDRSVGTRNISWGAAQMPEDRERDNYGRGRWEEGRMGMSQGYGYQDGDRPSFERGMHDQPHHGDQRSTGYGYRQHQTGFGGAQGLDLRRGPHRGKGPKGFEYSDERIRERACEALSDDHNIDASDIEVSVHKGEVMLTGTVDDRETKRMAEDCVLQCAGVRDVHNQLRIRR